MQGVIDYDKFRTSLERLQEQHENYRKPHPDLPVLTREAIAESAVRRFKTCYDCLWKVLRRYLFEILGVVDPPNSPKPVLRIAHQNHLLRAPVERWLLYADRATPFRMTAMARRPRLASMSWPTSSKTP